MESAVNQTTNSAVGTTSVPAADDFEYTIHPAIIPCQIVASSIGAFLCLVLILAICVPLVDRDQRKKIPVYNLYLVFGTIPELVINLNLVYTYATIHQWVTPYNVSSIGEQTKTTEGLPFLDFEAWFFLTYCSMMATMYINALIIYEVLILLRNSKKRRRSIAPSFLKATTQATVIYVVFLIWWAVLSVFGTTWVWPLWGIIIYQITITCSPILYALWAAFRIWYEGLLSYDDSVIGNRLTVLVRYFRRIILVNMIMSLTFALRTITAIASSPITEYMSSLLIAICTWVGFGLALVKPDVLESVTNIFACIPCRQLWSKSQTKRQDKERETNEPDNSEDVRPTGTV